MEQEKGLSLTESKEGPSSLTFLVSESGFGGQLFRRIERYMDLGGESEKTWQTTQLDGANITILERINNQGRLVTISARRSSWKSKAVFITPADETSFRLKFADNLTPVESPLQFCLLQLEIQERNTATDPSEKFRGILDKLSYFPPQSQTEILRRFELKLQKKIPFRIGCFVCLNMKCLNVNGRPIYYVGSEENRLETPRLSRRTTEILTKLQETGAPLTWEFLLADTDVTDIYGEWTTTQDQTDNIARYRARLQRFITQNLPDTKLKLWSEIQAPYSAQYRADFDTTVNRCEQLVGKDYIERSSARRLGYFTQKVQLPDSPILRDICTLTAKRNVALYAAQGPILNQEYDCLIIADPDPIRLGYIQSLLCPQLPIWYPYPG